MSPRYRRLAILTTALALGMTSACSKDAGGAGAAPAGPAADPAASGPSLATAKQSDRKIIRRADLSLTVAAPSAAQRKAGELAQRYGGYVESSTVSANKDSDGEPSYVSLVLRVDSDRLDAALDAIRALSDHPGAESISSEDVTEQYVDVDARLSAQSKLEKQYLKLLDRAETVDDTLKVQKQLGEVRSRIEQLEGKKRLLDHQTQLSTISLRLEHDRPLVTASASAIAQAAKRGGADVVNVAGAIVTLGLRALGVMIPVALLVLLPLWLAAKLLMRRLVARREENPSHRVPAA
jgi:hypothetical protein